MAATILASSMAFVDSTALNVVLPSLQKSLNASGPDLFWMLNAYLLILASMMLIGGALGDKLGRKKVYMTGIFIFIGGSAACGLAPNVSFLILFRVVQGIGGALMIPGSLSLISSSINSDERGKAIGTWSAFTTMVTLGGPILGGAFADAGLWRLIFFINVPIGLIALLILWQRVQESREERIDHSLDYTGAATITLALVLLTFGFLRIPAVGFNNLQVWISLVGGLVMFIAFLNIEARSRHAMMPLQLFSNLTFTGANLLTFFLYAGLGAAMLFLSLNMVQIQRYTQLQSGLTFLPFTILMITIARFAGHLTDKFGPRLLLIAGPATAGLGILLLSFVKLTQGPSQYWTTFFPGILVFGLGMAFTVAPLTTTVMGAVSNHLSGTASGINNAMTRIASVFANAIFGALAVLFFTAALQTEITPLNLNLQQKQEVVRQTANLGNAKVPDQLNNDQKHKVEKAYKYAFINSYRKIMRICAMLGFTGALMALLFIRNNTVQEITNTV
jgi:EmrB/QacA subfamily drug resistance transporter